MQITINIPEEFEEHFNHDKFEDSLERIKFSIFDGTSTDSSYLCGNYEVETMDMLIKALKESTPLPKGHGRLIDADALKEQVVSTTDMFQTPSGLKKQSKTYIRLLHVLESFNNEPTIIEADKESS